MRHSPSLMISLLKITGPYLDIKFGWLGRGQKNIKTAWYVKLDLEYDNDIAQ